MVSVIIPFYNQGAYIQEAIDSLKAQTYADWEIIIVNDGSDDEEALQQLVRLKEEGFQIIDIANSGVSAARNKGASLAKGDYLLFLDGDDRIHQEYLTLAIDAFQKDKMLDYVYCDIREFGDSDNYRSLDDISLEKVLLYAVAHVSGILKRELWEKSGGFDINYLKGWEDWDLLIRITRMKITSYKISEGMLFYRLRENTRDKIANQLYQSELEQQIFLNNIQAYLEVFKCPITILREHKQQKDLIAELILSKSNIYKTYSYRLGAILLYPFKLIAKYLHLKN